MPVRRKDVEGQPDNGGQFASRTPEHDHNVTLTPTSGSTNESFEWNVLELIDTTPAVIEYASWTQCNCGNSSNSDGFITTDERGRTYDDNLTCTGLICRRCGNFYPVDERYEGPHRIAPIARFDVSDENLKAADNAQWERLYGE